MEDCRTEYPVRCRRADGSPWARTRWRSPNLPDTGHPLSTDAQQRICAMVPTYEQHPRHLLVNGCEILHRRVEFCKRLAVVTSNLMLMRSP